MLFDKVEFGFVKLGINMLYDEDYGDVCYVRVMGMFDK